MLENLLDPWDDAAQLAGKLNQPTSSLIIGLGAEWCQLCTDFKPHFMHMAATEKNVLWLWYNLEEHEELLGEFYPETLPLVWVYQGDKLIRYGKPEPAEHIAESNFIEFIQSVPIAEHHQKTKQDLRQILLTPNWAA
jgi:thioredoxin-like negative regulator of GroEL